MYPGRTQRRVAGVVAGLVAATAIAVTSSAPTVGAAPAAKCPVDALKGRHEPVELVLWHSMIRANETALQSLVDRFEAANPGITVQLVNQVSYADTIEKYRAGLGTGDLPDLVQIGSGDVQQMIDSRSVVPVASCIAADDYDTSDFLDRALAAYKVDGQLWSLPFNASNPIMYYDKTAFRKADLDPERPPETLVQVKRAARRLVDSGAVSQAGVGLKLTSGYVGLWTAAGDALFVNHENGRKQRATAAAFDNPVGRQVFEWIDSMVDSGLARTNPAEGTSAFDNLLGIANGQFGITFDTSGALGTINAIMQGGQYPELDLGVAQLPGPVRKGNLPVGGASLYLVKQSSPEEQAAAWKLVKFLDEPEQQAEWAAATGFVPVRKSAVDLPVLLQQWRATPAFKVPFDEMVEGTVSPATAGAIIGDVAGVEGALLLELQRVVLEGKSPRAAIRDAQRAATAAIRDYNARVGA